MKNTNNSHKSICNITSGIKLCKNKSRRILPAQNSKTTNIVPAMRNFIYTIPKEDEINQRRLEHLRRLEIKANIKLKHDITGMRKYFCSQLRKKRKSLGITQYDLAFMVGIDQNYISRIENGKLNISLDTLMRVCHYLECWVMLQEKKRAMGEHAPDPDNIF